jgi:hypothetical protein
MPSEPGANKMPREKSLPLQPPDCTDEEFSFQKATPSQFFNLAAAGKIVTGVESTETLNDFVKRKTMTCCDR